MAAENHLPEKDGTAQKRASPMPAQPANHTH